MDKDTTEKRFLSDNARYADIINGFAFGGEQIVAAEDLSDADTQSGYAKLTDTHKRNEKNKKPLYRDLCRKTAFGMNFAIVAIENQEEVHYLMPLRVMSYDAEEYKRQADVIRSRVRKRKDVSNAEFLSGFTKEDRLIPCVTIVVYYGDEWDGSLNLHGVLDFTDIPEKFKKLVGDYHINILPVCKLSNTNIFRTDVKQVFDFVRYAKDRQKLEELVKSDMAYQELDEDAYDMIALFSKSEKLIEKKKYYSHGGKTDMCQALEEMLEDRRNEGRNEGRIEMLIIANLEEKVSKERILEKLQQHFQMDEAQAEAYFKKYAVAEV